MQFISAYVELISVRNAFVKRDWFNKDNLYAKKIDFLPLLLKYNGFFYYFSSIKSLKKMVS